MGYKAKDVNLLAVGLWQDIIPALTGIYHSVFIDKHQPCPSCGGTDRFRFDDLDGRGTWFCNQCGGKKGSGGAGDGLSLIMRINGWSFTQTLNAVGQWLNAPETDFGNMPRYKALPKQKKDIETEDWEPLQEQPESELHLLLSDKVKVWNPKKGKASSFTPTHRAIIRDHNGILKGAVLRMEIDNKKIPCQILYCVNKKTGETRWVIHGLGAGRPLYGAENIKDASRVILVMGERKKDIAQNIIQRYPFVSIVGGDGAATTMDFSPLYGKTVLIWPDNDWQGGSKNSGMRAARRIAEILKDKAEVKIVNPPGESKPSGWDLGDAFETDGWSEDDFAEYVKLNSELYSGYTPDENTFLSEDELKNNDETSDIKSETISIESSEVDRIFAKYIRFLGYDSGFNYYYSFERNQVISMSAPAHTKANLIMLMPEEIWKALYPEKITEGEVVKWSIEQAIDMMCRKSAKAGIYDPRNIRNGGCWWDEKRVVMHMGDHLIVDGEQTSFIDFSTRYIYQSRPAIKFDAKTNLLDSECKFIDDIANSLLWRNKASAKFCVGWILLAPICGLLQWRPHLWVNGSSGCGKSTVLKNFITPLLGGLSFTPSGSSTEAGIRQGLNGDSVPVVVDEAESSDAKSRERIQKLVELARTASDDSSSMIARGSAGGNAQAFYVRSMFGFAAINLSIKDAQDINRTAILELLSPAAILGADGASKTWKVLQNKISQIDHKFGQRLVNRTLNNVHEIMAAVDIMRTVVAKEAGTQRLGDTYGTLLAGWWMLLHDKAPSEEEALEQARAIDWSAYIDPEIAAGSSDADECLAAIMQVQTRGEIGKKPTTATIGELILGLRSSENVKTWDNEHYMSEDDRRDARAILGRFGVRADNDCLRIANKSDALAKGLKDSAFGGGWCTNLLRVNGAIKCDKTVYFGPGVRARCVEIQWDKVPLQ
jgi:putative DNA primase/helicase